MKVLVIAGYADSLVRFRGHLLTALRDSGAEVHVCAPDIIAATALCKRLDESGIRVHEISLARTGTNPIADLRTLLTLLRLIRRVAPDAVLAYTVKPVVYGILAAWLAKVPMRFALITGLGYGFTGSSSNFLQGLIIRLYGFSLSRAQKVFFQNPDDEALFKAKSILPASVPSVVLNGSGVDLDAFSVQPIPSGGLRFLLIARLMGDKGVREFIQAAKAIRARHSDVHFDLVGWLDSNPDAIRQEELDEWAASGVVSFLGKLDNVQEAISRCSVYVLPSYREGTPRTVLEAMAMGRAVITTDAPGCRETVIDGLNGFLVPVKAAQALEEAMLKFISDPTLADRMGRQSRLMAEQKYDVHKVNAVMLREMGFK